MTKILFICMGNICRSPAAEGIMQALIDQNQLSDSIWLDSCGTHGYHVGHRADERMMRHASKRGYELLSISRQFEYPADFNEHDYIIVMDNNNDVHVRSLDIEKKYQQKIYKMTSFCQKLTVDEVPDPYYGGDAGFEYVLDILEDACAGLLDQINNEA